VKDFKIERERPVSAQSKKKTSTFMGRQTQEVDIIGIYGGIGKLAHLKVRKGRMVIDLGEGEKGNKVRQRRSPPY